MKMTRHDKPFLTHSEMPRVALDDEGKRRVALLREAIEVAGEQKRLAQMIGIHHCHVSHWLNEARRVPLLADIVEAQDD